MRIDKHTKVKDILPLLTMRMDRLDGILSLVPECKIYVRKHFWRKKQPYSIFDITIGELNALMMDPEKVFMKLLKPRRSALIAFGQVKYLKNQLKRFENFMEQISLPQSDEEKRAAYGINFPNTIGRLLLTAVQFFHLHSMDQAEKVKLGDIMLVLFDQTSSVKYQRSFNKIQEEKMNRSYGKRRP